MVYAYGPDGFAQECVMPYNLNVMGYPFPPNTRAMSYFFFLIFLLLSFFLSTQFLFLFLSLTLLSSNCSPLSKSNRSWCGWPRISSWWWPTIWGSCMVLKERPIQAMVVVMMMVVERKRTQRRLLATNQGRGIMVDYLQSQHIYNKQHTTFSFFAFNIFLYSLLQTFGFGLRQRIVLRTSFTFMLLIVT